MSNEEKNKSENKKGLLSKFVEVEPTPKKDTPPLSQPVKKEPEGGLSEEESLLVNEGTGVNLVPRKSVSQIKVEKKKTTFSITSIVSLIVLVVITFVVVMINILSKQQLNVAKSNLYEIEKRIESYADTVISNDEILQRVDLYKHLEKGTFSTKEVVNFLFAFTQKSGSVSINTIGLGNDLTFTLNGRTSDLAVVAKLWYLLGTSEDIDYINLESVGKSDNGASFAFKGKIISDRFIKE